MRMFNYVFLPININKTIGTKTADNVINKTENEQKLPTDNDNVINITENEQKLPIEKKKQNCEY